jgi:pre-60S factor REI1
MRLNIVILLKNKCLLLSLSLSLSLFLYLSFSFFNESGTQLLMPSGRMAGARAYNMYWRQHLKPEESRDAILINQLRLTYTSMGLVSGSSRSIGGAVVAAARRQENVQRRVQAKMQVKAFQDHKSRIGMKANGLQKHFRHQNPL